MNGLSNSPEIRLPKEMISEAVRRIGLGETVRGETLTLEQFARLADVVEEMELPH